MNAYVQEWIWRFSRATGVAKYIFLAIGRRTKRTAKGEFETGPLPVDVLASDTGLVDSTVRKHVKALTDQYGEIDIVRDSRRGETYRYRLRRQLSIPLDADPAASHRRMAAVSPPNGGGESTAGPSPNRGGDTAESRRSQRRVAAVSSPNLGGGVSTPVLSSEHVRTEVLTSSEVPTQVQPAARAAAEDFLRWWTATFPICNEGAKSTPDADDLDIAVGLLAHRDADRLKAMAHVMWVVDEREDSFIAGSDRSLRVLRHKADWLDRRMARVADWWVACPHAPKCGTRLECHAQEAVG